MASMPYINQHLQGRGLSHCRDRVERQQPQRASSCPPEYLSTLFIQERVFISEQLPTYQEAVQNGPPRYAFDSDSDDQTLFGDLLISPPDNSHWLTNGWRSERQLDHTVREHAAYFRQVHSYLSSNLNTTLNEDMTAMCEAATSTYRALSRAIRVHFNKTRHQLLQDIEANHNEFCNASHPWWKKVLQSVATRRDKVMVKRSSRLACTARTDKLDDYIYRIGLQRQEIYIRTMGLQQW